MKWMAIILQVKSKQIHTKKFYETIHEPFSPDAISRAISGEDYYIIENGKLYYKSPKNSTSKKYKVILLKKMFQLINKANHSDFKRKIAKGKYNRNPIQFKTLETVEDAIKFAHDNGLARRIRGVNKNNQSDLELLNTINEALCNVHNKTGCLQSCLTQFS